MAKSKGKRAKQPAAEAKPRAAEGGRDPRTCYLCGKRAEFRYLCHRCLTQLPTGKRHQIHQVPLEQWLAGIAKYRKAG